jgi:hypothetical protein
VLSKYDRPLDFALLRSFLYTKPFYNTSKTSAPASCSCAKRTTAFSRTAILVDYDVQPVSCSCSEAGGGS